MSIGSSSASIHSRQMQRPDPAKMASDFLFSKLNTDGSGSDASGAAASQNDMLKHMLMQLAHAYGGAQAAAQSGGTVSVAA